MEKPKYDLVYFLSDKKFAEYVYENKYREYWEKFFVESPDLFHVAEKAKSILLSIQFKDYEFHEEKFQIDLNRLKESLSATFKPDRPIDPSTNHSKFVDWHYYTKIAAVFLIFISVVAYVILNISNFNPPQLAGKTDLAIIVEKVSKYERKSFVLSDGSKVIVNAGSSISFPDKFPVDKRIVYLSGEAFFEVAPDPQKPFIVETDNIAVKVLGTSFNLNSFKGANMNSVAVAHGKVLTSLKSQPDVSIVLNKNEFVKISDKGKILPVQKLDSLAVFGWKTGTLHFKDASIQDVTDRLSTWYFVDFEMDLKTPISKGFSATFRNETLVNVLDGLSFALDVKYELKNNKVKIYD
ncbi:MAG: FecR domain-containing protein [Cyclobacteriaceae bacterium]|nr:FecR domain-containing protein [Cyclobacteriaceae bacterium]